MAPCEDSTIKIFLASIKEQGHFRFRPPSNIKMSRPFSEAEVAPVPW